MKYSQIFGRTQRQPPQDAVAISHKLLYQAGYIRESTAGRYYLLPLGWRVHKRIQDIIKEEMDRVGAQEILAPVMHPKSLWQETNRTEAVGFELMSVKDRNHNDFVLGGTAEEMMVDLVRKFPLSYKDLPINIYQFSTKFRDEKRARGGLLRLREFVMKDAYSFHTTTDDFQETYEKMKHAYMRIFQRCHLFPDIVMADNGYIGGEYCHEFIVESAAGEGVYYARDREAVHQDVVSRDGLVLDDTWQKRKGIEVGNIFQLGQYYSQKMANATFTDESGRQQPYYMGCYGIGLARTLATVVEKNHDDRGIIWPDTISPFAAHLVGLRSDLADAVYRQLLAAGVSVLFDDRGCHVGEKLNDADLLGMPIRLIISAKTGQQIEWKSRTQTTSELLDMNAVLSRLTAK